jgi:uncharacterized membrane protein (DUF106 family)
MNKQGKFNGMLLMLALMLVSMGIGGLWNKVPIIKQFSHLILDPTAGSLLNLNVSIGMILIAGIISLATSLVQKYTMDHERMKNLKAEQKRLQEEMKKYKDHPQKLVELNKEFMKTFSELWDVSLRPAFYTIIPIILFFRWFNDYFASNPVKIFGVLSWFWAYLIFAIFFSMIFRKLLKLP